ncbi:MAG TPA: ABC transporter permease subunit [Ilumatobacter sp.]|nr:ABC transporter permease subunit [Ilumatobacter sp.]
MTQRAVQRVVLFAVALFVGAAMWEFYKVIGPADGGSVFGWHLIPKSNNQAMPHTWDIVDRMFRPESAALDEPIWRTILGYSWYTFRLALVGLVLGVVIGTAIAVLAARFSIAERAIMPWVIMSQTVPLIALAPQVVSWSGKFDIFGWEWKKWMSVSLLAAFLAFFPIAVGTLRGLKSAPPAALELMDSYAASWWRTLIKLRFPAAIPHIVPAAKLAATLSVVGVIVSEVSTGVSGGIGRAVISYQQTASGDPTKPYAAVVGAAVLGLALYGLVVLVDVIVMRNRPQEADA